jgi:hypothetical protein
VDSIINDLNEFNSAYIEVSEVCDSEERFSYRMGLLTAFILLEKRIFIEWKQFLYKSHLFNESLSVHSPSACATCFLKKTLGLLILFAYSTVPK